MKVELEVGLEGLEGPVVVDPGWSATGSMATPRYWHTATLLPNGKVLVAGGTESRGTGHRVASAELYDPATGTWSATGSHGLARADHTATLLPNGKVLVAGGDAAVLAPRHGGGVRPGHGHLEHHRLHGYRALRHTATLLPNGKVLVAGGSAADSSLASAELYDPATGTWSATGSMATARVLATRRRCCPMARCSSQEGTRPRTPRERRSCTTRPRAPGARRARMASPRYWHTATLLPNGKVLVVGGTRWLRAALASAELYDPATGTWSGTGALGRAARVPHGDAAADRARCWW